MMNPADLCAGCGRSRSEIANWRRYDEPTRKLIMEAAKNRLADGNFRKNCVDNEKN
jgi:predicted Fe-S protein YdhL (DUF1289 family)